MAISARTTHTLHEALGVDAADDVVNWMHQVESSRSELRELNDANNVRLDARADRVEARMDRLEVRMDAFEARIEARMDAKFAKFGEEIRGEVSTLRLDLRGAIADFDARLERRFNDLLKWSFVFWTGAVGAIAALAGILR